MARMARRINRNVKFRGVPFLLQEQPAIDAIKEADIIVGCLDTLHSRADLYEIAWRNLIPYIDIGMLIQGNPKSKSEFSIGGNVHVFIPGEHCPWCIDFISQFKLEREAGGRPRSYFEGADKQAQVVTFNGILANHAVNEVLQLITGFASTKDVSTFTKYNGIDGELQSWVAKKNDACPKCGLDLAAGDFDLV
jgi:molybdopterin/thiamine biosynthesis adenylyltransferase